MVNGASQQACNITELRLLFYFGSGAALDRYLELLYLLHDNNVPLVHTSVKT
ncbi:MAG: hypothetical protein ACI8WB_005620 [Phenylobacterium sp.]|jgi:hypothetical protein